MAAIVDAMDCASFFVGKMIVTGIVMMMCAGKFKYLPVQG